VTEDVFRRLALRARSRAVRRACPAYSSRTYLCRITQRTIEATVVASCDGPTRAVAMRLEHVNGVWLANELVII
jgi:hypothetical protein